MTPVQTFAPATVLMVQLAWDLGREHVSEVHAEFLDDALRADILPPQRTYEERVNSRIQEMTEYAWTTHTTWRGTYPGGPVDWETGWLR